MTGCILLLLGQAWWRVLGSIGMMNRAAWTLLHAKEDTSTKPTRSSSYGLAMHSIRNPVRQCRRNTIDLCATGWIGVDASLEFRLLHNGGARTSPLRDTHSELRGRAMYIELNENGYI